MLESARRSARSAKAQADTGSTPEVRQQHSVRSLCKWYDEPEGGDSPRDRPNFERSLTRWYANGQPPLDASTPKTEAFSMDTSPSKPRVFGEITNMPPLDGSTFLSKAHATDFSPIKSRAFEEAAITPPLDSSTPQTELHATDASSRRPDVIEEAAILPPLDSSTPPKSTTP